MSASSRIHRPNSAKSRQLRKRTGDEDKKRMKEREHKVEHTKKSSTNKKGDFWML
jgi:hypothetical protein